MEAALEELPLALFTTLAPLGAGAFVALALAFFTTKFSQESIRRIDRMTLVALAVVLVGFVASFFHLGDPLHAPFVLTGTGRSPLSNEIVAGSVFVALALVYQGLALGGKLAGAARKAFAAVLAVGALAFSCFTGLAYVMDTIASWDSPLVPLQIIGFSLLGGVSLGVFLLAGAKALDEALKGPFKPAGVAALVAGLVLAVLCFCLLLAQTGGMSNPIVSGADLVAAVGGLAVAATAFLVLGALAGVTALAGRSPAALALVATLLGAAGILMARLVFYALQLSVGLSF